MAAVKTIRELNTEAKGLLLEAKTILDLKDDATPEQRATAELKTKEAEAIVARLEEFGTTKGNEALKTINRIENTIASFEVIDRPMLGAYGTDGAGTNGRGRVHEFKTAGQEFVESEAYANALKNCMGSGGRIPNQANVTSAPVEVKTLYTSAIDVAASRPLLGQADRRNEIVRIGWNMLGVRDIITNLTTVSDTVEVVKETSHTSAAAAVAEATATSGSVGVKPESGFVYEVVQAAVQSIAHWIPVPTRTLSDARRLSGEIDAFLRMGIDQILESYIFSGTGTSPQFTGIYNTSGILTQATVSGDILATTRRAITKLMVSGYTRPTSYAMHPDNWEDIDLMQDAEARYFFGGPSVMGQPRLWGVPVLQSVYATVNLPLLGNFADAVIYDREQTTITMSGSHSDFFIRNLVAVLGEMRAAFHVRRPTSFVAITVPTHV